MISFLVYFLVLGIIDISKCDLSLQIVKKNEDVFYPVTSSVEENVGSTFSLICELVNRGNDSYFDDQLLWIKGALSSPIQASYFIEATNQTDSQPTKQEINKREKKFEHLKSKDKGNYSCISLKFHKQKTVQIIVRDNVRKNAFSNRPMRDTLFCSDHTMFQCMSNGMCIIAHYVCDGKPDCKDGSDESHQTCNGDPCKDKIQCEDGRCIPTAWCCDKNHDLNCTVNNRPKCCQVLSESYEELEYGFPPVVHQTQHSSARYLFISVCIVSILFSIVLLLLIVSKVVIFAKKAALQQQSHNLCENIALRNQTNVNIIPCELYTYRHTRTPRSNIVRNIIVDSSDVNDPLLFNPARFNVITSANVNLCDQPPSYVDVLRSNRLVSEPPPPYCSREVLNVDRQEI